MNEAYMYVIAVLFPACAALLLFQRNPFHAIVLRGALGALAALFQALLGAADVALTEALVGTLLSITVYAIAARSSLALKLGLICDEDSDACPLPITLLRMLRQAIAAKYLRLEILTFADRAALLEALKNGAIHIGSLNEVGDTGDPDEQFCMLECAHASLVKLLEKLVPDESISFRTAPDSVKGELPK
ncbi:MAG: DUF4040 domain-containing protein [Chitinivibrionales bacterium]|nr:DUF4040 domain-containing protein [Chitinivibrionales bacterium]